MATPRGRAGLLNTVTVLHQISDGFCRLSGVGVTEVRVTEHGVSVELIPVGRSVNTGCLKCSVPYMP